MKKILVKILIKFKFDELAHSISPSIYFYQKTKSAYKWFYRGIKKGEKERNENLHCR